MSDPLGEHRMFRRRQRGAFAAFVPALDGHPARLTLLHGRKQVALASGPLTVDVADRDVVLRLSIGAATFLIEPAGFRLAVYRPPPDGRLVVTLFDGVPLTLVIALEEGDEYLDAEVG